MATAVGVQHSMEPYTTRLQKGGALLADMRRLLLEWDGRPDCADRVIRENTLALPSRARSLDVVTRTFIPRFVRSTPPNLWRSVAVLERGGWSEEALRPIHYYAAAAAEPLLWDFVTQWLAPRYDRGQKDVSPRDVLAFLAEAPNGRFPDGRWSETVATKVARGLLAALRDFGVLTGATRKELSPLLLPTETFAFLVHVRRDAGVPANRVRSDAAWRLFYLGEEAVERFLFDAHQRKYLSYEAAGSLARLDFPPGDLDAYAVALTQRTH